MNLPDGKKLIKQKKPVGDWQKKGPLLNKSFYRFGSATNIRKAFDSDGNKSGAT